MSRREPRTVTVHAREGLSVPMEGSRRQIGEAPVTVHSSAYYRRQIQDGDLIVTTPTPEEP